MTHIIHSGGIAISARTGNRFIDIDAAAAGGGGALPLPAKMPEITQPDPTLSRLFPWATWGGMFGTSNDLPSKMIADIETCGILNSIIDHQSRFALGEGVMWAYCKRDKTGALLVEEICTEPVILEFMERNNHYFQEFGMMKDQIGIGNGVARFVLDVDRQNIVLFQRDDVTEMRYELMDEKTGVIKNVYLSAMWERILAGGMTEENKPYLQIIPLINPANPLASLNEQKTASTEFAYTFRYPSWGKKYYSVPLWYANLKWVKIAQSVPAMKAALYNNSMRPKYIITVYREHWEQLFIGEGDDQKTSFKDYTEAEIQFKKDAFYDSVDNFLVGAENAGKAIFVDGWTDVQSGKQFKYVEIAPIDDTTKDGGYLPDSAAANSEIAFSMRYNPAIIGASLPSGPYTNSQGGSNVREAVSMQIITHEPERQNIISLYKLIRNFNRWDKTFAKTGLTLEPIIPATMLATLDSGSGTKPVINGAGQPNAQDNTKQNGQLKPSNGVPAPTKDQKN